MLEALWTESPLTVGQIIERVQLSTDWHPNTIKTLLGRLHEKDAVRRFRDGRRFFYEPLVTREAIVTQEAYGLLNRFFDGKMPLLVAHFAKARKLSKKDIREMEDVLKKLRQDD